MVGRKRRKGVGSLVNGEFKLQKWSFWADEDDDMVLEI